MAYNRKSNQWTSPTALGSNITQRGGVQNTQQGQQVAPPGSTISQQSITPLSILPKTLNHTTGWLSVVGFIVVVLVAIHVAKRV